MLCAMVALLNFNSIRLYFGKLVTPGSDLKCRNVLNSAFERPEGSKKFSKILLDKIHLKPVIPYAYKSHNWIFD